MGNTISSRSGGDSHREASVHKKEHSRRGVKVSNLKVCLQEPPTEYPEEPELENDLNVSFGYHCRTYSREGDELHSGGLSKSFGESSSSQLGGSTPDSFTKDMSPLGGGPGFGDGWKRSKKHGSFSSLAGAALGANTTLSNTTLAHGSIPNLDSPRNFRKLGSGILSGSSFATSAHSSTSSSSSGPFAFKTASSPSPPMPSVLDDADWPRSRGGLQSSSAPSLAKQTSFLHANDLQMAGGCAGEDRVMAVCSEENGWLFCGVYDGFNGRDAADYLAANLYENICMQLRLLEWRLQHDQGGAETPVTGGRIWQHTCSDHSAVARSKDGDAGSADVLSSVDINVKGLELEKKGGKKGGWQEGVSIPPRAGCYPRRATSPKAIGGLSRISEGQRRSVSPRKGSRGGTIFSRSRSETAFPRSPKKSAVPGRCEACIAAETLRAQGGPNGASAKGGEEAPQAEELFRKGVVKGLTRALAQTETDFMDSVELEMDERPDLVMVGSCVLAILMHGQHLYALNLGDSRAVLATKGGPSQGGCCAEGCEAVQLTQDHKVADVDERDRLVEEHPDDDTTVWNGRVKGKLAVTRAFGAGYLKKKKMNDALMGILRVSDLESPPYISTQPWVYVHQVTAEDRFVILSSDGLNDFFTNQEAVHEVCRFMQDTPEGDPAKHLLEQLLTRAASNAGLTVEQLKTVPSGRRRKYHDDITIVIIMLQPGNMKTSSASTMNGIV